MKKLNRKDLKTRYIVKAFEERRALIKSAIYNADTSMVMRIRLSQLLMKMPKKSSKTQIVNRCVLTGRGRGVFNLFNMSRIQMKHFGLNGAIPGLKKISW